MMRLIFCLLLLAPVPAWAALSPVKIAISQPGIYGITQLDLTGLGIDTTSLSPDRFRVTHRGQEIDISVSGATDGSFDLGDGITFYVTGIPRTDPLYAITDTDVYWLWLEGNPGLRMNVAAPTTLTTGILGSHTETVFQEENSAYLSTVDVGTSGDRWLWGNRISAGERRLQTFAASAMTGTGTVDIRVQLLGVTDDIFSALDHHTQIWLNTCLVDDLTWDGISLLVHSGAVASSCLIDGQNTLAIESLGGNGSVDSIQLDWFEVSYNRKKTAVNNELTYTEPAHAGVRIITLNGFSRSDGVLVFDVTDPIHPRQLAVSAGLWGWAAFKDRFTGSAKDYVAIRPIAFKHPDALVLDAPSSLMDTANGADLIIITHGDMIDAMQPLATFRRNQNLRVAVVDVQDIYDEFAFGVTDPQAIKDFLSYAYQSWALPKPLYVMLAGDGTVNFKWQFVGGSPNYVPTHFYPTADGGTAPSDHWFVTVDGNDPIPDMFIGRLPVTPANVVGTVQKIIRYESQTFDGWEKTVQLAADDVEPIFEAMNTELAGQLPASFAVDHLNIREMGGQPAGDQLKANIDSGRLITTFSGHGAGYQWADENILNSDDAATRSNGDKLTFLIGLNCASGYFVQPWHQATNKLSMAESFVTEANGGAIGAWVATWVGFSTDQRKLGRNLFKGALNQGNRNLGSATTNALIAALGEGVPEGEINAFHLFGDPSGSLGPNDAQPEPPRVVVDAGAAGGGGGCSAVSHNGDWGDVAVMLLLLAMAVGRALWIRRIRAAGE